jgi:UDP-N-acetylglucosamine 2-epimerase (non-hydrolysing)
MARSSLILTDSGGIQEEAAFLGRRVLLLRETTERPEAVACGSASLVGTDADTIVAAAEAALATAADVSGDNPFGPPGASRCIAATLAPARQAVAA